VNGDGYADVVVGASSYDGGQENEGRAYVYTGTASGLSATATWTAEGDQADAYLGIAVGTAGDVNGDGYADVVVGAYGYDVTGTTTLTDAGRVYVFTGTVSGLSTTADWTAEGDQADAYLGIAVGTAGDVNGDGYADVVVGARGYDAISGTETLTSSGRAYVYHGSAAGLSETASWTAESDLCDAYFGHSVGTAGDVNGDGYADVVVGAYRYDVISGTATLTNTGRVYVYHGAVAGLSATADWTAESDQAFAYFGISAGTAGDVNGDGYADVVVGAHGYDAISGTETLTSSGRAYVYHGSAAGLSETASWTADSGQAYALYGISAGTAGDVNGDGYADVVVGAYWYDHDQTNDGGAFVYHGSATGLSATADWTATSDQAGCWFGYSVDTAGDVNGDGYADVVVGAPGYHDGETKEGRAFVYHGGGRDSLDLLPRQMRTDSSVQIAPLGTSDSDTAVQVRLIGRMPLGREQVKLEWQVAPLGTPFTATSAISGTSNQWTDVLTTGVVITRNVTGLTPDTPYHWRVRLLYRPGNRLGQSAGRWIHVPWNGWTETDFRTADEPIAGLAATNDSPTLAGQLTTLTATVTAGTNVAYTWAFGDGEMGSGSVVTHTYLDAGVYTAVVTASNSVSVLTATTTVTITQRVITYEYDPLNRLIGAEYSTGESFEYAYDAVGNRTMATSTTPLSGTVVTTYTYDIANRLTDRAVSDGRVYTYTWSQRGQLLAEWTQGVPVRTFTYDAAGQMVEATVFTLTTRFTYNGLGARVAVEVVGQGTITYTLDYAAGNRILAEETITGTTLYLYGGDCLGEYDDAGDEWLYYLPDAEGLVRQGMDEQGEVVSTWLFDPDGTLLEGPEGLVSHLICGGVYDWSTGLIYKDGRYFDPLLGIWLALMPLVVVQSWRGRKRKGRGLPWVVVVLFLVGVSGTLTACGPGETPPPEAMATVCATVATLPSVTPAPTPTPTPTPTPVPPTETPTPSPPTARSCSSAWPRAVPSSLPKPPCTSTAERPYCINPAVDDDVTMVAHVLMEEIMTTFGEQGGQNVAKVIENRRTNDPSGQWPDTALGIVAQSNAEGTQFTFVAWTEPSSRGSTAWSYGIWDGACRIAYDLVNQTAITGYHPRMGNCRWYHSCRTDLGYEPVDPDYVHSEENPLVGTVYYYEHPFLTDARGWNCKPEVP
jgi:YD repeat-containing protein